MVPDVGVSRPATIRSVVVLPQPDGPSRAKNEPAGYVEVEVVDGLEGPEVLGQAAELETLAGPPVRRAASLGVLSQM